ncbi:MAG: AEC family transporter [Candidatus Ratteibacteria bacterium]|jgi:predicted permease
MFIPLLIRVFAIFFIIALGALARKLKFLDTHTAKRTAVIITNFFYPALIFSSLTSNFTLQKLASHWVLPAATFGIMAIGYFAGIAIRDFFRFSSPSSRNVFLFQTTINNYSFLPMPIVLMYWGDAGIALLIFSTLGSEIAVWTLGILGLTGNTFKKENLRHLFSMPMLALFSAIIVLCLKAAGVGTWLGSYGSFFPEISASLITSLDMFGKAAIPLAMFVAGSRLLDVHISEIFHPAQFGIAGIRLLFVPAVAIALLIALPISKEILPVLATVAVMPCAIASVVLSETYGADAEYAAAGVFLTHVFGLITIPAWLTLVMGH